MISSYCLHIIWTNSWFLLCRETKKPVYHYNNCLLPKIPDYHAQVKKVVQTTSLCYWENILTVFNQQFSRYSWWDCNQSTQQVSSQYCRYKTFLISFLNQFSTVSRKQFSTVSTVLTRSEIFWPILMTFCVDHLSSWDHHILWGYGLCMINLGYL